jgi:uncharacterized protein (TIGR00369 family)
MTGMSNLLAPKPRERTIRWDDPQALAAAARSMSGREFLEAILRDDLPLPPICRLIDFRFDRVEEGRVEMVLTPNESHYNPIGSVHGGIIATALDSVTGCAVHTMLPAGTGYTTLDLSVAYLRGITIETGPLRVTGRALQTGRRAAFAEADITDANGRTLATATSTLLVMER